jgi:hypothetical protein
VGALAALAGFIAGGAGTGGDDAGDAFRNSASAGSVELEFPDGWKRVAERPRVPGVRFKDALVLTKESQPGARLAAGQVEASGPSLLAAGLSHRLPGGAPAGDPVRLGRLQALSYHGLKPSGAAGELQLYAVPTSGGVATIACSAPAGAEAGAFRRDCERIASTLRLIGAKPYPLP